MTLKYFLEYFPDHAGFVDLVLQNNDKKYIQKVDIDGIVLGFEEVDLEESIHLADLSGKREARIGQQAWCGFRTKDGNIIIRQWQDMQDYLRENFVHYSDMVFLSYDIAEFLGDEDKQVACVDLIIEKKNLFDVSSWLGREYLALIPVLALWKKLFPDVFSHLRSVLQRVGPIEPAVQQLAYKMWEKSVWNPQYSLDFWLAAEKHVLILTAAAICSPSSSGKTADEMAPFVSAVSGAAHLKLIERFAHGIWEHTGRQYGYALDHWLAAEKQVLAASVAVIESASDAQQAMLSLPSILENLDPAKILQEIGILAKTMWERAGRQHGHTLDFWVAAERYVLTLTIAAIRQAPTGNELTEVVVNTITALSPLSIWRTINDSLFDAQRRVLTAIADGRELTTVRNAA